MNKGLCLPVAYCQLNKAQSFAQNSSSNLANFKKQ